MQVFKDREQGTQYILSTQPKHVRATSLTVKFTVTTTLIGFIGYKQNLESVITL